MEVNSIQYENQTRNIPKLCAVQPSVWVRMLAQDRVRHVQAVYLPHYQSPKNPQNILAEENHQRGSPLPKQLGRHVHPSHKEAMEMDRPCVPKERRLRNKNHNPLDTWREDEKWTAKNNMAQNSSGKDECSWSQLGYHRVIGQGQDGAEELCRCPDCQ